MKKGRAKTATHDYRRNGTTTLFAAIELLTGNVVSKCMPRHRHQEWLKFLRQIDEEMPPEYALHLIVDTHPRVLAIVATRSVGADCKEEERKAISKGENPWIQVPSATRVLKERGDLEH